MSIKPRSNSGAVHPFDPDLPLSDPADDKLGRKEFAEEIAAHLTSWKGKESLVLSINGEWGSGKTTIKNFIKSYLLDKSEKPLIVEFTPWQWSASDKIFDAFFREIGIVIGKSDRSKKYKNLTKRWKNLASYFHLASPLLKPIEKFASILFGASTISPLAKLLGFSIPAWTVWISIIIGVASAAVTFSSKVTEAVSKFFQTQTELASKSQEEVHEELKKEMEQLGTPVIVFLDDLDRLSPSELRTTIQLIKANCRLPNLIYVAFFEQKIVEDALSEVIKNQGGRYLQKIVQHPFNLPQASQSALRRFLTSELNSILTSYSDKGVTLDSARWRNDVGRPLLNWFSNLRETKRYLGSIQFLLSRHCASGRFEVDFIDLITLEAIRLKKSQVYEQIATGFHFNEQVETIFSGQEQLNEAFKQNFDSILGSLEPNDPDLEVLSQLLQSLLPQARENIHISESTAEQWLKDRRICHKKHFRKYFHLRLDDGDISSLTLSKILSPKATQEEIKAIILQHDKTSSINDLLEALHAHSKDFPSSNFDNVTGALFDCSDELTDNSHLNFFYDSSLLSYWLLGRLLENQSLDEASETFLRILDSSYGLTLPTHFIRSELSAIDEGKEDLKISENKTSEAKDKLLGKIRQASIEGRLLDIKRASALIFTWAKWSSNEEVKEWTTSQINEGHGISLMAHMLSLTESSDRGVEYWLHAESVEKILDLDLLHSKTANVDLSKLDEKQTIALQLLREAMRRKEQGKSYREVRMEDLRHDQNG